MKKLIHQFFGRPSLQPFFQRIHSVCLHAMGIGIGGYFSESGESIALNHVKSRLMTQSVSKSNSLYIFDVGANKGEYTQHVLDSFTESLLPLPSIYAFEPSQQIFNLLKNHHKEAKTVHPFHFGFGSSENTLTLFSNSKNSGISSVYNRKLDHAKKTYDTQETVTIKTIDGFCKEHSIKRIHFLKLDVEGHELSCLQGAQNMLSSGAIDFIQFEFGGCNIDSRTFFQDFYYLLKDKYRIYRIMQKGLFEISEYKENYEVFLTTNFLAEKR